MTKLPAHGPEVRTFLYSFLISVSKILFFIIIFLKEKKKKYTTRERKILTNLISQVS